MSGRWTRVAGDATREFVYGPSLGRLYLLTPEQRLDRHLHRVLGLGGYQFCERIADPVGRLVHDRSSLRDCPAVTPPTRLCFAYRLLHRSRRAVPLRQTAGAVARFAARTAPASWTAADIGRVVHGVERAVGIADCYPRALLTAYLCLRTSRACELVVGALAPTRKMHAWCSTEGLLPYEPLPEHHLYQPLFILTLTPGSRAHRSDSQ